MQRGSKRSPDGAERNPGLPRGVDAATDFAALHPRYFLVMPAHSRSKNGVASLAYVAGIHVFAVPINQRRGWPEQVRP
jgi:hypothetical protein